jgi:uncharacterized protein (DUF924 family)
MDEALKVREFWFGKAWTGPLPIQGGGESRALALSRRASLWFETNPQLQEQRDELIKSQFLYLVDQAAGGQLDPWADSPRRRLSLLILLDQFTRQIYRGTAQAFAYDAQALRLALSGMECAADAALNVVERIFFYMPLQHAESQDVQDESVAAYRRLVSESPMELRATFENAAEHAQIHRELIRRFGRFPHRNRLLGRSCTPQEEVYLKEHATDFGQ